MKMPQVDASAGVRSGPGPAIRRALPSDASDIARIWNHYIRGTAITFNPDEKTADQVAALLADRRAAGHGTFVAVDGGRLLGFATYGQFRGGAGYARTMEHTILLDPQSCGIGAGRALLAAVEDHARRAGAVDLYAGVSGENPAGRAFHERMGFALIAVLPEVGFKFGRAIDLHLLRKRLI
jgi:phosphinothricin acetyltransferase